MMDALVLVGLTVMATLAFYKGEFAIIGGRKIDSATSRSLGWILAGGVVLTVLFGRQIGSIVGLGILLMVLLLGVMLSSKSVSDS